MTVVKPLVAPCGDILVVDDSRTALTVIGNRLSHLGYSPVLLDNAPQALDLVQARRFDLVILDMAMPGMSGLAALGELRASLATRDLPVLMMTARSDPGAAIEALRAGADDHVVKPFDFDALAARIERLLDRAARFAALRRDNAALDARIAQRAAELQQVRASLLAEEAAHRELQRQYQSLNATVWRG
jgi:two-component system, OmpR family, response regulator